MAANPLGRRREENIALLARVREDLRDIIGPQRPEANNNHGHSQLSCSLTLAG